MDDKNVEKTAFVTHHRLFCYKRMPFWLKPAPEIFRRAMEKILASVKSQCAIVYIDDNIIFSKLLQQHPKQTVEVLGLTENANKAIKVKKCHFFCKSDD